MKEDLLDYYLGRLYASDLLLEGNFQEVMEIFKKQIAPGNLLEKQCRERIVKLEPVKDRCFISKKHLQYLQSALRAA